MSLKLPSGLCLLKSDPLRSEALTMKSDLLRECCLMDPFNHYHYLMLHP